MTLAIGWLQRSSCTACASRADDASDASTKSMMWPQLDRRPSGGGEGLGSGGGTRDPYDRN